MGLQANPGRALKARDQGVGHGDQKAACPPAASVPLPGGAGTTWRRFLAQQASGMVACGFFTVETVWLRWTYVLVFIELATRRGHLAGCTTNPDGAWVVQQARHFRFHLDEREEPFLYPIHDLDAKFCGAFDETFRNRGTPGDPLFL
jgi:putative transposase